VMVTSRRRKRLRGVNERVVRCPVPSAESVRGSACGDAAGLRDARRGAACLALDGGGPAAHNRPQRVQVSRGSPSASERRVETRTAPRMRIAVVSHRALYINGNGGLERAATEIAEALAARDG